MIVTKIKRVGSTNRYNVYVDDKWAGIFLDEILVKENIKTNATLDEHDFQKIKKENDEKLAFDMAATYLEKYVVSEKGVKDYLKKKGFDAKIIASALNKLHEYGFIDDEKFAKNYVESISKSKGKRAVEMKLKQKGISQEIVDSLLENVDEDEEIENATHLAEKFVKNRQKDTNLKQKCLAHLVYKGYDYSVAVKVANSVCKGENNDWD